MRAAGVTIERYPEHEYLNVTGGFLSVEIDRIQGVPTLTARHHSVGGVILNEDLLEGALDSADPCPHGDAYAIFRHLSCAFGAASTDPISGGAP